MVEKNIKNRFRKFTAYELVDLPNDDKLSFDALSDDPTDYDGDAALHTPFPKKSEKIQKRREKAKSTMAYYTIVDIRDGSSIQKLTASQRELFFDACKEEERKHFISVLRDVKSRGKNR